MVEEGELKKRLRYIQGLGADSEAVIDEAKKEFPEWEEITSDEFRGTLIQFDGDKVKQWFVKYFGDKT